MGVACCCTLTNFNPMSSTDSNLLYLPWPSLVPGHRVLVERGPLMGLQGVLLQIKLAHRLVVSINLLECTVAFELDASWVRPIDNERFTQLEAPRVSTRSVTEGSPDLSQVKK